MESASSLFWKHAMNGSKIKEINYEIETKKLLHPPSLLITAKCGFTHFTEIMEAHVQSQLLGPFRDRARKNTFFSACRRSREFLSVLAITNFRFIP